jgi:hypothetical protein
MKTIHLFLLATCILVMPLYNPAHAFKTTPVPHSSKDVAVVQCFKAQLCNDCGFGNKKENCVKCGKWVANNGVPARLCSDCGFGSKENNCVKCGKWVANNGVPAKLCNDCGFGNKKENCCKCSKWAPK